MPAITLKALPVSLHRQLKTRAARHKRSLNQEVIAVLEDAVAPAKRINPDTLVAESQQFRSQFGFKTTPSEIDQFKRAGRR
ncbi:MAG: hypothetical protein SynsKO_39260 [Synoicihabitans sp.]